MVKANAAKTNESVQPELGDANNTIQTLKMENARLNYDIQQLNDALNTRENDKQQLTNQFIESEHNYKSVDSKLKLQLEENMILKQKNDDLSSELKEH